MNMLDDVDFLLVAGWTRTQSGFWTDPVRDRQNLYTYNAYTTEQAVEIELERREGARLFEKAHRLAKIAWGMPEEADVGMASAEAAFFAGARDPQWCASIVERARSKPESDEIRTLMEKHAKLGEQIEEYEIAATETDEPASIPPEMLTAYEALGAQLEVLRNAARGEPKITVTPVEPIESKPVLGFVSRPGHHAMEEVMQHTYPPNPTGRALRTLRHRLGVSLSDVARVLSLSPTVVSGLDRGSHTTDDAGWTDIVVTILALALLCERDKDSSLFGWAP